MNPAVSLVLLGLLFAGPISSSFIERNIESFFLAIGLVAMTVAGAWKWPVVWHAAYVPVWITLAVIVAGVAFDWSRGAMDRVMTRLRARVPRRLLCGTAVFLIALVSALITAIVAALALVETLGLMRLQRRARVRVTVAGCFAIGLGSALTALGAPLSTLAESALKLGFGGLFIMLAPYVLPGVVLCSVVSGLLVETAGEGPAAAVVLAPMHVAESFRLSFIRGIKIYVFIAGLVLVGEAFAPLALRYVPMLGREALFWANTVSAVLDNSTLVAVEIRAVVPGAARDALLALLVSGGMLIPGNVPNIVAADVLRIRSGEWAKIGVPMGLILLGLYFAAIELMR